MQRASSRVWQTCEVVTGDAIVVGGVAEGVAEGSEAGGVAAVRVVVAAVWIAVRVVVCVARCSPGGCRWDLGVERDWLWSPPQASGFQGLQRHGHTSAQASDADRI